MKKIFLLSLFVFFITQTAFANDNLVTKIVFTSDPQDINPGEVSEVMSIQTQNDSSLSESVGPSTKLKLISTSPTGIFYDASISTKTCGKQNSGILTMSSSSSNKGFCYSDLSSGSFTITVSVQDKSWSSAMQSIQIGQSSNGTENPDTVPNQAVDDDTDTVSAHSGSDNLVDFNKVGQINYSAGRQRIGYVGIPVEFNGIRKSAKNLDGGTIFHWTYGDGFSASGQNVSHIYKFAGDYDVVLHADRGDSFSVSRTKIKIISPSVSISFSDGNIKVKNDGNAEINIGGWMIRNGMNRFIFPEDTIIGAHAFIILMKIDVHVLSETQDIELINPLDMVVSRIQYIPEPIIPMNSEKEISLEEAQVLSDNLKFAFVPENFHENESINTSESKLIPEGVSATSSEIVEEGKSEKAGFVSKMLFRIKSFAKLFYAF